MFKAIKIIILLCISASLCSCNRDITLTILNHSQENITIEYRKPSGPHEEFYLSPKTYLYNHRRSNFQQYSRTEKAEPTMFFSNNDPNVVRLTLEPGKVLIIGKYNASLDREELIHRYSLKLDIGSATTTGFEAWQNFHNEVLTVRNSEMPNLPLTRSQ